MIKRLIYDIKDVEPYINWLYFYHAWGLSGKPKTEREKLRKEADEVIMQFSRCYHTYGLFGLFDANSDGDDIIINGIRIPFLRQQKSFDSTKPNLCLSDYVRPVESNVKDCVGVFAATVDIEMEMSDDKDVYRQLMTKTVADRLAEATAEKMHEEVRTKYWGYAADEHLTIEQLHREEFIGIRPAVGYPSMPDASINFLLSDLIDMPSIGIRLTESGAMKPHASVSGLMLSHPQSHYFNIGTIGEDQLHDYAKRRHIPLVLARRFLASNLE